MGGFALHGQDATGLDGAVDPRCLWCYPTEGSRVTPANTQRIWQSEVDHHRYP